MNNNAEQWAQLSDRFWGAIDAGDLSEAMTFCLPNVTTWHNFDRELLRGKAAETGLRAFVDSTVERTTSEIHRDFFQDGIAQQHILTARWQPDGPRRAWPVCVLMHFQDGKIASIKEYIDRAGSFDPDAEVEIS